MNIKTTSYGLRHNFKRNPGLLDPWVLVEGCRWQGDTGRRLGRIRQDWGDYLALQDCFSPARPRYCPLRLLSATGCRWSCC